MRNLIKFASALAAGFLFVAPVLAGPYPGGSLKVHGHSGPSDGGLIASISHSTITAPAGLDIKTNSSVDSLQIKITTITFLLNGGTYYTLGSGFVPRSIYGHLDETDGITVDSRGSYVYHLEKLDSSVDNSADVWYDNASIYMLGKNTTNGVLTMKSDAYSATVPRWGNLANTLVTYDSGGGVQILGTTAGDNAAAGFVGQYIQGVAAGVALSNGNVVIASSITLSAGDWDVQGSVTCQGGSTNSNGPFFIILSTTTALNNNDAIIGENTQYFAGAPVASTSFGTSFGKRFNVTTTTAIYLKVSSSFSGGTPGVWSKIFARRRR